MLTKNVPLRVKAVGPEDGLEDGEFIAYASVFDNVDSYGDVVRKGAFKDTLEAWSKSGRTLPVLYGHDMVNPFNNLGPAVEYREDDHGLLIKGRIEYEDNPTAKQVYKLIKGKRVGDMSFAYDEVDAGPIEDPELGVVRELRALKLYEVSIVPIGANQETEILAVKTAATALVHGLKTGRVISAKNESSLRAAYDAIGAVLAALEPTDDGSKAMPLAGNAEEPPLVNAKAEEPGAVNAKDLSDTGAAERARITAELRLAVL